MALSLEEGQHLRAAIHRLNLEQVAPLLPSTCGLGLRILPSSPMGRTSCHLLASYGRFEAQQSYQLQAAEKCLHFTNCDYLTHAAQLVLLRVLRSAPLEKRRLWWEDVRRCRRRRREIWKRLSVRRLFLEVDEFKALATETLLKLLRTSLEQKNLWPADVFYILDQENQGYLLPADLERGVPWMLSNKDISIKEAKNTCVLAYYSTFPALLETLFATLDLDRNGRIDLEEFKVALEQDVAFSEG